VSYSGEFPCRQFALFHGRIPVASLSGELPWRPLFGRTRYSGVKHFGRSRYSGGEQFGGTRFSCLVAVREMAMAMAEAAAKEGPDGVGPFPVYLFPQRTSCSGTAKAIFYLKDREPLAAAPRRPSSTSRTLPRSTASCRQRSCSRWRLPHAPHAAGAGPALRRDGRGQTVHAVPVARCLVERRARAQALGLRGGRLRGPL
jgi:hypothetical protein